MQSKSEITNKMGLTESIRFECSTFDNEPEQRKLLIFVDGTNNDSSHENSAKQTNVYRMSRLVAEYGIESSNDIPQASIYSAGVGSGEDDPNYVSGAFRFIGGAGVDRILNQVYLEIIQKYQPGDQFYIFGFSRGATIARLLSNRLLQDGIPKSGHAHYRILSEAARVPGQSKLSLLSLESDGEERREIEVIEALGLWDSVASTGLVERIFAPKQNLDVSPGVQHVYHLVSIDENRIGFSPTLINPRENVTEVWFPGVHSDVGGSYQEAGLANIAFQYMKHRVVEDHQIGFFQNPVCPSCEDKMGEKECKHPDCHVPNFNATIHRHPLFWPKSKRKISVLGGGEKPVIHVSAFQRRDSTIVDPKYTPQEIARLLKSKLYITDNRD